jgi:hypothetical protein
VSAHTGVVHERSSSASRCKLAFPPSTARSAAAVGPPPKRDRIEPTLKVTPMLACMKKNGMTLYVLFMWNGSTCFVPSRVVYSKVNPNLIAMRVE